MKGSGINGFTATAVATAALLPAMAWAEASTYVNASWSMRDNDVITVLANTEVEYETSAYTRFEFSQKLYEDFRLGGLVQVDDETNDVIGYAANLTAGDWIFSFEQSRFSGDMVDDGGAVFASFEDNQYLDIKLMKMTGDSDDPIESILSHGVQYLNYERPAAFEQSGIEYYDETLENQFLAYVFELDGVKNKLINGGIEQSLDWYFYTTTGFGIGHLESASPKLRNNPGVAGNPDQTSWTGLGLTGEYELGLVYFVEAAPFRMAAKLGLRADLEGPVMFHDKSFDVGDDVHPDEQLFNYGPSLSLAATF